MPTYRAIAATSVAAPSARDWSAKETNADYDVYEGNYGPSPNYQSGSTPFVRAADGGGFVFENGVPKAQGTFDLRFALSVPNATKCPAPPSGYPIVRVPLLGDPTPSRHILTGIRRGSARQPLIADALATLEERTRNRTW